MVLALARVAEALPAISKSRTMTDGPRYQYRGVEDITAAAAPLLAKEGVVFAPNVTHRENVALTINNKPWTECWLTVRFRIYGPGGLRDYIEVTTVGVGRDNSDKAGNKAMTAAFKYALTEVLCITDQKDDADEYHPESDEASPAYQVRPPEPDVTRQEADAFAARLQDESQTPPKVREAFMQWKDAQGWRWPWSRDTFGLMFDKLAELLLEESGGVPDGPPDDSPQPPEQGQDPLAELRGGNPPPVTTEASERPTEAAARRSLDAAHAVLDRRTKFEEFAKSKKVPEVRAMLEGYELDNTGDAKTIRDRLVDHLMRQAEQAEAS